MGQKTHPHGLRIGIHRKWNYSWYGTGTEGKNLYFHQYLVEEFMKVWFSMQRYVKIVRTKRLLLVDLKLYKQGIHQYFMFVFYYKLRTKRRKAFKKRKRNSRTVRVKERLIYFCHGFMRKTISKNWRFI